MINRPGKLVTPQEQEYDRAIKVAVVTDLGIHDPEEELEAIVRELQDYLEADVEVVVQGRGMHVVALKSFDLLVLDYGGASVAGGTDDLADWQVRAACEWAEGHPGKVLLLWTTYTSLVYGHELEEQFGHLSNVMYRFGTKPWNCHGDGEAVFESLKGWFWPENEAE